MGPVSVIILAYGDEPLLAQCVDSALGSRGVQVEVILVDNGSGSVSEVTSDPRVRVLSPGSNTGFAGGCNLAVSHATTEILVFINSDLIVEESAIATLIALLDDESVGLVTGAVLLPGDEKRINSIGNPIHYLMFSWAGLFGEPFEGYSGDEPIAGVSGAFFASRRDQWLKVGGFDGEFFAYAEDADVSLRTWQSGHRVVFEPAAVGVHHYEFSKNTGKWFLLERNRLICFFTLYDPLSVVILMPIFLPVELGILLSSLRGGWISQKFASWRWLLTHRHYLRERRRTIAIAKVPTNPPWTSMLAGRMDIPPEFGLSVPSFVNWVLEKYWDVVRNRVG
jgi:GT2 family glycosyltransferase